MDVRSALVALAAVLTVGVTAGCGEGRGGAHPDAGISAAEFRERNLEWRQRRLERLTEPYGWLSLIGLVILDPGTALTVGSAPDSDIVVPRGPARWGTLRVAGDGRSAAFDVAQPGGGVTVDGQPGPGGELSVDGEPTRVEAAGIRMHLVDPGGQLALRIRDPEAPTRQRFAGLDYFGLDPSWRVDAAFEPHPTGRTIRVANVMGQLIDEPNPGRVRFTRNGQTITLEAVLSGDEDELFFIFADRTSGRETYGLGRFLYADLPADGRVMLDFNQAYNPPCAFNAYTTCPLPPPGNRVDAEIRAGEKEYAGEAGTRAPRPVSDPVAREVDRF
jgi:hypothetical protein